jgi:hypothetical protein
VPRHHASNQREVKITFMLFVTIQELEAAINYWRSQSPSEGDELRLCPEAAALAKPYALMIVQGAQRIPVDVLDELARSAIQQFQKIA